MTRTMTLFLDRVAIKMNDGCSMEQAMQAVCDDDKRIVSVFLNLSREQRREFSEILAEDIFKASKA